MYTIFDRIRRKPRLSEYVTVGRHTYGATPDKFAKPSKEAPVTIGNFCSIAKGVKILCNAEHSLDYASTFPFRTFVTHKPGNEADATTRGPITIGHDVWIGQNAIILSGAQIGTGSVIGAGCVVGGTIPPYSIVIGNPKKILRTRHAEYVDRLLESHWWDLSDDEIAALDDAFYSTDIEYFLRRVTEVRK